MIKRMVRDLDFPLRVEVMPIVREEDGLAMSSRNVYLEPADRVRAVALSRALAAAEQQALALDSLAAGLAAARIELAAAAIEPEYLEARDAETLEPVEGADRPPDPDRRRRPGRRRPADRQRRHRAARRLTRTTTKGENTVQRQMLKSKIHRATVTDCDVDYIGSITIDTELMAGADLLANEQVHVWDVDNGERFVTYVIEGEPGSGAMQVNGAAAHLVEPGHKIIVASFGAYDEADLERYAPVVVHVDDANKPIAIDDRPEVLVA